MYGSMVSWDALILTAVRGSVLVVLYSDTKLVRSVIQTVKVLLVRNHEGEVESSLSAGACLTFLAIRCYSLIECKLVLK